MFATYTPIADNEDSTSGVIVPPTKTSKKRNILLISFSLVVALVGGAVGFAFGQAQHNDICEGTAYTFPDATVRTTSASFTYNLTFAEHPSPETNAAWDSIFPPHGGFFHDPLLAPDGASLAVYHQLHCVDAIRQAYYTLLDAVTQGKNITFSELDDYQTDWHTRHCIDFLRQMLMCNADLTVEQVDPSLGGITGFGRLHKCIIWEDVIAWSVAHQNADSQSQKEIIPVST